MNAVSAVGAPLQSAIARLSSRHRERPPGNSRKATPMNTTPFSTLRFTSTTASDRPGSDQDQRRSTPQGGCSPRLNERWSSVVADRQAMPG